MRCKKAYKTDDVDFVRKFPVCISDAQIKAYYNYYWPGSPIAIEEADVATLSFNTEILRSKYKTFFRVICNLYKSEYL